jgi:GNAT superfamily N-acetyltransferase
MIKRITNPEEFCELVDQRRDMVPEDDYFESHALDLKHSHESIKLNLANKHLLAWDFFVWANKSEGKFDGCIAFVNDKNVKFDKDLFSEFVWISKNPKIGFKLLKHAVKFAREKNFEIMTMSVLEDNPNSEKIERFYKKLGFLKDSTTYITKL